MPMAAVEGANHIVRYVNPAFCLLVGKRQEELIGNAFSSAAPAGDECLSLLDRVYQTRQAETHTGQEHSDSHPFYWSYAMWPVLVADGRIAGIIIQVTETTAFHQLTTAINQALMIGSVRQHELTEAAAEALQRSNEELRRANQDLEEFVYAASHDLQEPLRNVTCCIQLLVRKFNAHLDPEAEEFIEHIVEGNSRMSALIKDLLAYARVGAEQQARGPVECGKAVAGALANLKGSLEETHSAITCDPLPWVNANLPELTQLFQNLIGNALKYRKPDCLPNIHIMAESHGDEWVVSVRDNGIGFDPQYAERIFRVFQRLHNKQYPGTGIGLAICKRIVERHCGTIWASSEAGKGATFFFTMPRVAGEADGP
jgi:light-regulated signal transduction histidine kinase (bacteriophytochrome)